jgi:hypothetical protein
MCYDLDLYMYTQCPVIAVDVVHLRWYYLIWSEDDPVKGVETYSEYQLRNKTNVDTIVSILFY